MTYQIVGCCTGMGQLPGATAETGPTLLLCGHGALYPSARPEASVLMTDDDDVMLRW